MFFLVIILPLVLLILLAAGFSLRGAFRNDQPLPPPPRPNPEPWIPKPEELEQLRKDIDVALSSDFKLHVLDLHEEKQRNFLDHLKRMGSDGPPI